MPELVNKKAPVPFINEVAYKTALSKSRFDLIQIYHRDLYKDLERKIGNKTVTTLFPDSITDLAPYIIIALMLITSLLTFFVDDDYRLQVMAFVVFIFFLLWVGIIYRGTQNEKIAHEVSKMLDQAPHWTLDSVDLCSEEQLFLQKLMIESEKPVPFDWVTMLRIRYYAELVGVKDISNNPNLNEILYLQKKTQKKQEDV